MGKGGFAGALAPSACGGGGIAFPFASMKDMARTPVEDRAGDDHLRVSPGFHYMGVCSNQQCSCFGKDVVVKRFFGTFNIAIDSSINGCCPMCEELVSQITDCCFYRCSYEFCGRRAGAGTISRGKGLASNAEFCHDFCAKGLPEMWHFLVVRTRPLGARDPKGTDGLRTEEVSAKDPGWATAKEWVWVRGA